MTTSYLRKAQSDGGEGTDYQIQVLKPVGAEDYPSLLGVGSEAGEKEGEEAGGRPPFWFLLVTPPGRCIPGTSFCSFRNPGLGLPWSGLRNCPSQGLLHESPSQCRKNA